MLSSADVKCSLFFGEGPRAPRKTGRVDGVLSHRFDTTGTFLCVWRNEAQTHHMKGAPAMMFALLNVIVGLVVSLDEEDPRHRADAVSQGNVPSMARVFDVHLCVRRRA